MHKALIQWAYDETVVGHLSREGAVIEARETPLKKQKSAQKKKKTKRGRPRKGEERPAEPTRLALQGSSTLSLKEMIASLPTACDTGTKRNAKGHTVSWHGTQLHIDAADGDSPVSCLLRPCMTVKRLFRWRR